MHVRETPIASPVEREDDAFDERIYSALVRYVDDCNDENVQIAVHADGSPGMLVAYLIPVDREKAAQPTQNMWGDRNRMSVDTAITRWADMLVQMAALKGISVDHGITEGAKVDFPGWVALQFFVPFSDAHHCADFMKTAKAMRDILTRTTLTW
jgi:hypothetical protein